MIHIIFIPPHFKQSNNNGYLVVILEFDDNEEAKDLVISIRQDTDTPLVKRIEFVSGYQSLSPTLLFQYILFSIH